MDMPFIEWPGMRISEDSEHRLVTDEQISRWDSNGGIIEITKDNWPNYFFSRTDINEDGSECVDLRCPKENFGRYEIYQSDYNNFITSDKDELLAQYFTEEELNSNSTIIKYVDIIITYDPFLNVCAEQLGFFHNKITSLSSQYKSSINKITLFNKIPSYEGAYITSIIIDVSLTNIEYTIRLQCLEGSESPIRVIRANFDRNYFYMFKNGKQDPNANVNHDKDESNIIDGFRPGYSYINDLRLCSPIRFTEGCPGPDYSDAKNWLSTGCEGRRPMVRFHTELDINQENVTTDFETQSYTAYDGNTYESSFDIHGVVDYGSTFGIDYSILKFEYSINKNNDLNHRLLLYSYTDYDTGISVEGVVINSNLEITGDCINKLKSKYSITFNYGDGASSKVFDNTENITIDLSETLGTKADISTAGNNSDMNDFTSSGMISVSDFKGDSFDNNIINNLPDSDVPIVGGQVFANDQSCIQILWNIKLQQYMRVGVKESPTNQLIWGEWNRIEYGGVLLPNSTLYN